MPSEISNSASGTAGGYMNFTNGFGIISNRFSEEQYDGRLTYTKKIASFDITAVLGGNVTEQSWFNNSATMNVWGNTQFLINPDVYNFSNTNVFSIYYLCTFNKSNKKINRI